MDLLAPFTNSYPIPEEGVQYDLCQNGVCAQPVDSTVQKNGSRMLILFQAYNHPMLQRMNSELIVPENGEKANSDCCVQPPIEYCLKWAAVL